MKMGSNTVRSGVWFILEVIGILALVQVIRYAFGNWEPLSIALALLAIAIILFIVAFITARIKGNHNKHKPSSKAYTSLLG
jgi:hypothetical protein